MQASRVKSVVRDLGKLQSLKFPTRLKSRVVNLVAQLPPPTLVVRCLPRGLSLLRCPYVVTEWCNRLVLLGSQLVVMTVTRTIRLRNSGMFKACPSIILRVGDGQILGLRPP